jgi:hypothetical protein
VVRKSSAVRLIRQTRSRGISTTPRRACHFIFSVTRYYTIFHPNAQRQVAPAAPECAQAAFDSAGITTAISTAAISASAPPK